MSVQNHSVTFTPTQVYGSYVTPILVLPAPTAGYVNNLLRFCVTITYNSTAYSTGVNVYLGSTDCNTNSFTRNGSLTNGLAQTTNVNFGNIMNGITTQAVYFTTNATATLGDSNVTILIAYETKPLS